MITCHQIMKQTEETKQTVHQGSVTFSIKKKERNPPKNTRKITTQEMLE